jgi:hypothetical protein
LLLVKVNGTTLQVLPLDKNGGATRPPLAISFPARLLNPGANQLTFEATVPGDPADLPCAAAGGTFMTILGQSDLTVPAAPRMRIVGMGPALLGMPQSGITLPDAMGSRQDLRAQTAALALMSKMRPLAGQGVIEEATLTVVSIESAEQLPLDAIGLTRRDLITALPVADIVEEAVPANGKGEAPVKPMQLVTVAQNMVRQVVALARPGDPDLHDWLVDRRGKAVLFMPNAADPAKLWLVVGPDADPVRVAQAVAVARTDPDGPRGQVAILTEAGLWQDWRPASAAPELEEPLTVMNFRFVIGTFASWSPLYFVLLLLALTAVSVLLALIFVVSTRGGRKL